MWYSGQPPWLLEGTIKDNIVMGSTWCAEKYARVLRATGLRPDLQLLPGNFFNSIFLSLLSDILQILNKFSYRWRQYLLRELWHAVVRRTESALMHRTRFILASKANHIG